MFDLICDIITCSVWICDVGKINLSLSLYDKIMTKNQKEKILKSKKILYINFHLIDGLGMEFTAC